MEARKNTNKVIEYMYELGECNSVVESLLKYLSDDDVKDWAILNGYWPGDYEDEDFSEEIKDNLSNLLQDLNMEQREQM